jgi:hypothetical protein
MSLRVASWLGPFPHRRAISRLPRRPGCGFFRLDEQFCIDAAIARASAGAGSDPVSAIAFCSRGASDCQKPTMKAVALSSSGSIASSQGEQCGYHDTSDHYHHCAAGRWRRLVRSRTLVLVSWRDRSPRGAAPCLVPTSGPRHHTPLTPDDRIRRELFFSGRGRLGGDAGPTISAGNHSSQNVQQWWPRASTIEPDVGLPRAVDKQIPIAAAIASAAAPQPTGTSTSSRNCHPIHGARSWCY